jgi:hypothetical protein
MQAIAYDHNLLQEFESGINPLDPENGRIPAKVLGYGEMSTVLTIDGGDPNLVYKRMPMFQRAEELQPYMDLYNSYLNRMQYAGVHVVPAAITAVQPSGERPVVYIIQERLDSGSLANQALHTLSEEDIGRLFEAILEAAGRIFTYNATNEEGIELGLDAQMSNWAIAAYDPAQRSLPATVDLTYLDTSSPLMRRGGEHLLDPELFLRSAPSFLRPVLRYLYVDDVLNRYFDQRQIIVDVLGNLYKEKRADVLPDLVQRANEFLAGLDGASGLAPIEESDVARYYQEDARIWTIYLGARRLDRRLHRLLGKPYPYILPGHIDR